MMMHGTMNVKIVICKNIPAEYYANFISEIGIFVLCAFVNYKYSRAVFVGSCDDGVKTHLTATGRIMRIMVESEWQNYRNYFVTKLCSAGK
jgi:hypothetical protein